MLHAQLGAVDAEREPAFQKLQQLLSHERTTPTAQKIDALAVPARDARQVVMACLLYTSPSPRD